MQKIMKCGLIGGFILFLWGAAFWTLMPWKKAQVKSFASEREVANAIRNNIDGSGLYLLPNLNDYVNKHSQLEAAKERMSEGPFATVAVRAYGKNPNIGADAITSFILRVIVVSLATVLLLKTQRPLDFTRSVKFFTIIGLIVAFMSTIPYFLWFGFPLSFSIASIIETAFGWLFAGLAVGRMVAEPQKKAKK